MPRLVALLYDLLLALAGAIALLLIVDESVPLARVFNHLPVPLADACKPLRAHVVQVVGGFVTLLMLRFVFAKPAPLAPVGSSGSMFTSGPDYESLDRESPQAIATARDAIQRIGDQGAVEIIPLMDEIILAAVWLRASDIHIEPKGKEVKVAVRIDGILKDLAQVPKDVEQALINRLKVMSRLDISKVDQPQDGRVEGKVRGRSLNLRVSIFPTLHGEKAVIRILDASQKLPRLQDFGIQTDALEDFRRLLHSPQGMLLFTGPTGSGKTTLMYASLREILGEESKRNIVTLEDPIEQELEDINQSQVDAKRGLTFAAGLRTLLRQDPDIIMVGEIRDLETAKIALQAGQTGHLILSTVHANSAAASFGRLIEMGIEPFLLASAVSGVVAQRLVRKLCPACKTAKNPPAALLEQAGPGPYFEGTGCADCNKTGFNGRLAIFELLRMNEHVADAVLRKASAPEIEKAAKAHGMRVLMEDGLAKVHAGQTSLVELLRVVQ